MVVALWIIAVCEVVRAIQNMVQIRMVKHDSKNRDNVYSEFIKSLNDSDKEFVRKLLEEYENHEHSDHIVSVKLNDDGSWNETTYKNGK